MNKLSALFFGVLFAMRAAAAGPGVGPGAAECRAAADSAVWTQCALRDNCAGLAAADIRPGAVMELAARNGQYYAAVCLGQIDPAFERYMRANAPRVPQYRTAQEIRGQELQSMQRLNAPAAPIDTQMPATFADLDPEDRAEILLAGWNNPAANAVPTYRQLTNIETDAEMYQRRLDMARMELAALTSAGATAPPAPVPDQNPETPAAGGPIRSGMLRNGRGVVDIRKVLSDEEIAAFSRAAHGFRIISGIGETRDGGTRQHEGTDFARRIGDPIPALFDGRVFLVAPLSHRSGLQEIGIRNDNGTTAHYLYVAPGVRVGDRVKAGDTIGYQRDLSVHPAYATTQTHMHFELWRGPTNRSDIVSVEGLF